MKKMAKKTSSAGGVVLGKNSNILLVQEYGQYWGFPRGHIKQNESPIDAAMREIYEEAGVRKLTLIKELGSYERCTFNENGENNDKELKHITFFLFTTTEEVLHPQDAAITNAEWVPLEEIAEKFINAKDIAFFFSQKNTIKHYIKMK
jgi:tRNA nucleotidyltransferase (CCA-adding enzyme)